MAKKETLGLDAEGRYRRYLGWKLLGDRRVQHLFRLGKVEERAKLANGKLEKLWEAVVTRWKRLRREGRAESAEPMWDAVTLTIGQAIARGQDDCVVSPPANIRSLAVELQVAWLARLQADFPFILLSLVEPDIYINGVSGLREVIEVKQKLLTTLKEPVSTHTLYQALDAYRDYIGEKYAEKPSKRPQQTSIALLKQHSEDHLLDKLDADRIETWLAYWCRRLASKDSGQPLAFTTCRNTLIVMRQFLRWLSRSQAFAWTLPGAFVFPRCKITGTGSREEAPAFQAGGTADHLATRQAVGPRLDPSRLELRVQQARDRHLAGRRDREGEEVHLHQTAPDQDRWRWRVGHVAGDAGGPGVPETLPEARGHRRGGEPSGDAPDERHPGRQREPGLFQEKSRSSEESLVSAQRLRRSSRSMNLRICSMGTYSSAASSNSSAAL